jgi:ferredoxin
MYRVTVDKGACEGIFACLVRDDRFVEAGDGLASVDPGSAADFREDGETVVAEFDDDRVEQARQAAAACPPDAIAVEEVPAGGPADQSAGTGPESDDTAGTEGGEPCR